MLQSKRLRLATGAPWYVRNRQIHEDLDVPLFADHIRALTESFDSKLAYVGNPLVRQLGRYLSCPRVYPVSSNRTPWGSLSAIPPGPKFKIRGGAN